MMRIAAALVAVGALLAAGEADEPPIILTARTDGVVFWPGQSLEVPFVLRLRAGLPMRVDEVRMLCRCATVGEVPRDVRADADARIAMRIHAPERRMPYGGTLDLVGVQDGRPARVRCQAAGAVRDFIAWPENTEPFDLGTARPEELPQRTTVRLPRGDHPEPWDRLGIEVLGGDGAIAASASMAGDGADLTIEARPGLTGSISARLRFVFATAGVDSPYRPVRLVRIRIDGPLAADPPALLFGGMRAGSEDELRARLVPRDGAGPAIVAVAPADPGRATATVVEGPDGRELVVRLRAGDQPGNASSHVDLRLADGTVLRVPYLAQVAAQAPR